MASNKAKLKAFTLQELLVVLIIIGILTLMVLPNLLPLVTKAKSTEAKIALKHIHTLQKNYFLENSKYAADFESLGYEPITTVDQGGDANYAISIVNASAGGFIVQAEAVVDFDGDGIRNKWHINQDQELTEVVKD